MGANCAALVECGCFPGTVHAACTLYSRVLAPKRMTLPFCSCLPTLGRIQTPSTLVPCAVSQDGRLSPDYLSSESAVSWCAGPSFTGVVSAGTGMPRGHAATAAARLGLQSGWACTASEVLPASRGGVTIAQRTGAQVGQEQVARGVGGERGMVA